MSRVNLLSIGKLKPTPLRSAERRIFINCSSQRACKCCVPVVGPRSSSPWHYWEMNSPQVSDELSWRKLGYRHLRHFLRRTTRQSVFSQKQSSRLLCSYAVTSHQEPNSYSGHTPLPH